MMESCWTYQFNVFRLSGDIKCGMFSVDDQWKKLDEYNYTNINGYNEDINLQVCIYIYIKYKHISISIHTEGRYGLVDKTHPLCARAGFNLQVQYDSDRRATTPPLQLRG